MLAVAANAAFMPSSVPVLVAAASLVDSAISLSECSLNFSGSSQMSSLALVGAPFSEPGPKPAQGNLAMYATTSAFSCAALASNGTLPAAIAPRREKCWPITNSEPWRYLMASSALANWAAAGKASIVHAAAAANVERTLNFMGRAFLLLTVKIYFTHQGQATSLI